jgi:hypothetical protein
MQVLRKLQRARSEKAEQERQHAREMAAMREEQQARMLTYANVC